MLEKLKVKDVVNILNNIKKVDISKYEDVFNSYDLRGEYDSEIDEVFSFFIGLSLSRFLKEKYGNGRIVVGYDTRVSSNKLKDAFISSLIFDGWTVVDVGISTTDKVSVVGSLIECVSSVMITASHHPYTRSGFKFMYHEGNGYSNEDMAVIKSYFREYVLNLGNIQKELDGIEWSSVIKDKYVSYFKESDKIYLNKLLNSLECYFPEYMDKIKELNNKGFKIVVDACNGGSSFLTKMVYDYLGIETIYVNCDGIIDMNINPNPKSKTRSYLTETMKEHDAWMAVGYDVDADRIFMIHKDYGWIDGQKLFVILAKLLKSKSIVASLDTSKMLELNTDAKVVYTRVGDIFVSKKALEIGADFCGEPNGHYAFPRFSLYNSGVFASVVLVLNYFKIPEIIENMKVLEFREKELKFESNKDKHKCMDKIKMYVRDINSVKVISEEDGIKFEIGDVSCLIRPSGTKAVVRITYEGKDDKVLDEFEKKYLGNIIGVC